MGILSLIQRVNFLDIDEGCSSYYIQVCGGSWLKQVLWLGRGTSA